MDNRLKNHNTTGLGLTLILVLFSLTCCSTLNRLVPFLNHKHESDSRSTHDVSKFLSTVRPVNGMAEAHYRLGRHFQDQRKHRLAVEEFKATLRLDPTNFRAYNALGISYDCLGHFNRAVESYKTALKINSKLDYVYNNLGYSYLLSGKIDLATEAFKKAIEHNGENKKYHNNLALAHAKNGRYDLATDEFRRSVGKEKAYANLTKLKNRHPEAASHDRPVLSTGRTDSAPWKRSGKIEDILTKQDQQKHIALQSASPESLPENRPNPQKAVMTQYHGLGADGEDEMAHVKNGGKALTDDIETYKVAAVSVLAAEEDHTTQHTRKKKTYLTKNSDKKIYWVSTGIGSDQRVIPNDIDYDYLFIFSNKKTGKLFALVDVQIFNDDGVLVFEQNAVGPWLYLNMPADDYCLKAKLDDGREQGLWFTSSSAKKLEKIILAF